MPNGGIGPLPYRLSDFLSSSYYIVSIIVVALGLVTFITTLKWRVDNLELREKEHPTRQELAEVAIKVDDRLRNLETHLDTLDKYGTRALADRTTQIEQGNRSQDERLQDLVKRINELQSQLNQISNLLPIIQERQNNVLRRLDELEFNHTRGRSPVGPEGPGARAPR